jgi:hypothetical protein
MRSYLIGNAVRTTVRFRTPTGSPVDPSTVTLHVKDPALVVTDHVYGIDMNVIKESTGVYHFDVALDQAGEWHCRWEGTGSNMAANEHQFLCVASSF